MSNLVIHPAIQAALKGHRPVVALETSVIAQGLPHPHNLEAASRMDRAIREHGAVPAMIGVIDGEIRVGLEQAEIERLAAGMGTVKIARRDLAAALALGETGGTTVSATVHICRLVGIEVFATGGIGGVHPNAGKTFDISGDIAALAGHRMIVVCSGAKSILDLPATVEALETSGITVLGYQTSRFPAFYLTSAGLPVQRRIEDAATAARLLRAAEAIDQPGAILVTVPTPQPLSNAEYSSAQTRAQLDTQHLSGNAVTPALLAALGRYTSGKSLASNLALLERNAKVGAEIAVALMAQPTAARPAAGA